ncbi:DUF4270 family protein [Pontibacter diazotrophicus]|uniref:DUF4270 family protein n=1 Tax=Pontibacter diazotrophicus TaxID=1400979 RepID=A0A3D8LEE1_9BACT|nr:DUF4270 family protein [Pontibacter diazotrophicus]RDV15666.1 DUF4270 family protein [Pontibacter diazotrophicus]
MQFLSKNAILRNKITLFLCCCLALASCEDPNELGVGLVDDNIAGRFTDTLTVNVSTVYLDSVATSGQSTMLVGQFSAPYSGTLESNSLFQLGLGSAWTVAADATYDSLQLVVPLSGYYYGDTTQAQTLEFYRLTSDIQARRLSPYFFNEEPASVFYTDNALYNISRTDAAPEPFSSFTFTPRPVSQDTLAIPLSDELGQEWLDLKKAGDSRLADATNFLNYFKGLKVASTEGSAVLGYALAGARVRLYYSETVDGTLTARTKDFTVTNSNLQYNQIETDLEGTPLEGVTRSGGEVPAEQTGNVSVTQAGAGLMIKLEFPYLNDLSSQLTPDLINRAVLVVEPLSNTTQYPAPATLSLYSTNRTNVPFRPLLLNPLDANSPALTAAYQETSNRYEFNLTPYIIDQLKTENTRGNALFLAPPVATYIQSVSRLVVGGPQSVKLRLYYTTIK